MRGKHHPFPLWIALIFMLLLIFFGSSAAKGIAEGIELCIQSVIPALFPFFVLTSWASPYFTEMKVPGLAALARYLHIPKGSEMIFVMGLLGGYPVGAQTIALQWRHKNLTKTQAHHLLGFCNNAGPGFIFGISGILFRNPVIPWCIWGTQISSAILTGILLPCSASDEVKLSKQASVSITAAMRQSVIITGSVCGWIIFTKAFLGIITPFIKPPRFNIYLTGIAELSAGCLGLIQLPSEPLKFILMNLFLSFGGICVWMQTHTVTEGLGTGLYLPGKIIQLLLSLQISILFSLFLFSDFRIKLLYFLTAIAFSWLAIGLMLKISRKKCGNYHKVDVQ